MNNSSSDPRLDALWAASRAHRPDTSRAEYAFETRLLARLRATRSAPAGWSAVSWRLIPLFSVVVAALTLWQTWVADAAQNAQQIAAVENPEAVELWNHFD